MMQGGQMLCDDLDEVLKVLDESFATSYEGSYEKKVLSQSPNAVNFDRYANNVSGTTTVINNNYGPYYNPSNFIGYPPLYPVYPVQQTVIYNSSPKRSKRKDSSETEEKSKNKSLTRGEVAIAATGIGVVTMASAYVLSQDEYVKLYLSKLNQAIKSLTTHTLSQYDGDIKAIVKQYNKWIYLYQSRTLGKCQAKIIGSGSLATGIGGFVLYSNVALFGGLIGAFACSGYLLWKYMTDNLRKEQEEYFKLREDIKKLISFIKSGKRIQPSAPLQSEAEDYEPPSYDDSFKSIDSI
jgi:hypothetical protein